MVRLFSEQTFKNLATATTMSHLSFIQCSDLAVKLRQLAASLSIFSVVGHGMELEVLKTKRALARAEWPKSASIAGLLRFGGRQYAIKLDAFSRARQPIEVDPVCHRFTANPLEREE